MDEMEEGFEVRLAVDSRSLDGLNVAEVGNIVKGKRAPTVNPFTIIPDEIKIRILSYLDDRELIVASGVSCGIAGF